MKTKTPSVQGIEETEFALACCVSTSAVETRQYLYTCMVYTFTVAPPTSIDVTENFAIPLNIRHSFHTKCLTVFVAEVTGLSSLDWHICQKIERRQKKTWINDIKENLLVHLLTMTQVSNVARNR